MKCLKCGTKVDNSMQFCPECGFRLEKRFCGNCGQPCMPGDVFCANCGSPVGGNPQQPIQPTPPQQPIQPVAPPQQEQPIAPQVQGQPMTSQQSRFSAQPSSPSPTASSKIKKILIGAGAAIVVALAIVIGVFFYQNQTYMDSFKKYVQEYEKLPEEYMIAVFQDEYDKCLEEAEECINKKKKSQAKTVWNDMKELRSRIIDANDKAAKYQEVYDGLEDRFATYIMEEEDEEIFSDYKQELADAIKDVDVDKCQETTEEIDSFESDIRDSSVETISQMQSDINSVNSAIFYSAEISEWKKAKAKGDKLAKNENYREAKGAYDTCMDILESARQSESYSMKLSQVDVTDFPKVKLYLSVKNLITEESIEDLEKSGFVIREKIEKSKTFKELKVEKAAQMNENEGLNTAIVADVSASMGSDLYTAEDAMANFVQGLQYNVNDRAALYSFADDVYREQYFTQDKDVLQDAIYNLQMGNMTALYDALVYSISDVVVEDGAKCVIAFTDGMENNSHSTKSYVISKAKQYDIPIYIIGIGSGVDTYDLQDIANQTGGFYRGISSISSMESIYNEIYAAQKAMYVLQYTTQKKKKAKLLREIYIRYSDDNYKLRTEESYTPASYKIDNFIFYDSDSRYLKEKELASLSEEEVLIALNEIYARRGYKFSTNEFLIDHFSKCSWYKGKYTNQNKVAQKFNKYESANVRLLVQYEKKHQLNNRK